MHTYIKMVIEDIPNVVEILETTMVVELNIILSSFLARLTLLCSNGSCNDPSDQHLKHLGKTYKRHLHTLHVLAIMTIAHVTPVFPTRR